MTDVFSESLQALLCCSVEKKIEKIRQLRRQVDKGDFPTYAVKTASKIIAPGRPVLPLHVHPTEVKRRRLGSVEGRVALIHAIAHIEFNAMNLALDAVYRFRDMPCEYYRDWMRVASEEATHFELLSARLNELSSGYGALPCAWWYVGNGC